MNNGNIDYGPATRALGELKIAQDDARATLVAFAAVILAWRRQRIGATGQTLMALYTACELVKRGNVDGAREHATIVLETLSKTITSSERGSDHWSALAAAQSIAEWVLVPEPGTILRAIARGLQGMGGGDVAVRELVTANRPPLAARTAAGSRD